MALDELERNALTELVNIGVSRAAASLRKTVNRQIILSVPSVEITTQRSVASLIGQRESETLIALQQQLGKPFSGLALLILPESKGLSLVRAINGDEVKDAALAEVGNAILNGCLGSIDDTQHPVSLSLPDVWRVNNDNLFGILVNAGEENPVLFLHINLSVRDRDIRGYIAIIMDPPSLERLKQLVANFIDRAMSETE